MSLLKQAYATPSRVFVVYRYLAHCRGRQTERSQAVEVLSPKTLPSVDGQKMVERVIDECISMELIQEEDGLLSLAQMGPDTALPGSDGSALRLLLTDLILRGAPENHDLGRLISWYLHQDISTAPGDWDSFSAALADQVGSEKLDLTNDVRFGQFKYWASFLGFGWSHVLGGREWLVPDPSAQLRWRLPEVFQSKERLTPSEAVSNLSELCPVFEGGWFRTEIESLSAPRLEKRLSTTTAHAWFRLQDEGRVSIESATADAGVYLFPVGNDVIRCSALVREGAGN